MRSDDMDMDKLVIEGYLVAIDSFQRRLYCSS